METETEGAVAEVAWTEVAGNCMVQQLFHLLTICFHFTGAEVFYTKRNLYKLIFKAIFSIKIENNLPSPLEKVK